MVLELLQQYAASVMLFEKSRKFWQRVPYIWKTYSLFMPLFTFLFALFLTFALREIQSNTISQAKVAIMNIVEKISKNEVSIDDTASLAKDIQLVVFNLNGQPLASVNQLCEQSVFLNFGTFQHLKKEKILLLNTEVEIEYQKYLIQVGKDLTAEEKILSSMRGFFILILFAALFLGAALSIPITRILLRNILRISQAAEKISYEDLTLRIESSNSGDEFDLLINTLNKMLERIQISADAQKKFVANASHELKTPISVINGYSQMLNRWGSERPDIVKEAASVIAKEVTSIKELIEDLLQLSKLDANLNDFKPENFVLGSLILDIMQDNRLIYPSRDFLLGLGIVIESQIFGDKRLIKALIRIITDNAIKYTPQEKPIEYNLSTTKESLILNIVDHGSGISDEHKEKVFERFYRIDEDRNRDKGGSGLGLSIAKGIAEIHKAKITILDTEGGGCTFQIVFPLVTEEEEK